MTWDSHVDWKIMRWEREDPGFGYWKKLLPRLHDVCWVTCISTQQRDFLSICHRKWVGSQAIQTQVAACFLTGEFSIMGRHSFRYYSPAKWNSLWSYGSCVRISLLFLKLHWKLYIWTKTVGHSVINTSLLCSRLISAHVHITHFYLLIGFHQVWWISVFISF